MLNCRLTISILTFPSFSSVMEVAKISYYDRALTVSTSEIHYFSASPAVCSVIRDKLCTERFAIWCLRLWYWPLQKHFSTVASVSFAQWGCSRPLSFLAINFNAGYYIRCFCCCLFSLHGKWQPESLMEAEFVTGLPVSIFHQNSYSPLRLFNLASRTVNCIYFW